MFCEACGQRLSADISECPECGAAVSDRRQETVTSPPLEEQSEQEGIKYAGFWWRIPAIIIDFIIIYIFIGIPIAVILYFYGTSTGMPREEMEVLGETFNWFFGIPLVWLYFAIFEASGVMGTPGKRLLGLKVTDLDGNRIGFRQASRRYWARFVAFALGFIFDIIAGFILKLLVLGIILLAATLLVSYLMAGWTKKKQALHDIIAHVLVLKR